MDRRRFAQLSVFTLAASRLPAHAQAAADKPVGFAIIGLGSIGGIFARACAQSQRAKVTALVTGEPQTKGKEWAARYGVPESSVYSYADLEKLRGNPAVDAVYVALPNSLHREYTMRSARIGKHVLCEKPMAISSAECRDMIAACREANVKLMIAYRVQYDPTWMQIRDLCRGGAIGDLEGFQGGFYQQKQTGEWRLDRKLAGGGSLLDLGIYPLNATRWISGEEPASYAAQVSTQEKGPRFASVEQNVEWTMKMPSGILCGDGCSYGQTGTGNLTINGSKGWIHIEPAFSYDGLRANGRVNGQPWSLTSDGKAPFQFTLEADHFAHCVRSGEEPKTPGEEGLRDMLVMEAIYKAAGAPIA